MFKFNRKIDILQPNKEIYRRIIYLLEMKMSKAFAVETNTRLPGTNAGCTIDTKTPHFNISCLNESLNASNANLLAENADRPALDTHPKTKSA